MALRLVFSFLNLYGPQVEDFGTLCCFMHLSKQMLYQRREPTEGGSCRAVLLVNAPRESGISLTNPINPSENVVQMKINK